MVMPEDTLANQGLAHLANYGGLWQWSYSGLFLGLESSQTQYIHEEHG